MKQLMKNTMTGRKRLYLVGATFLVVVLVNLIYVNRIIGFWVFDDELGYWSNAAHLAGYDWSGMTKNTPWYSYGYSLVLYVLIRVAGLLGGNMIMAYRLAVCANALMCGGVFLLGYGVIHRLTDGDEWMSLIGGAASALTTMLIFQSRIGWTECTLTLLTTGIAVITLYDFQRKHLPLNVLLSMLVGYTYMVHNRMMGLVLAFAIYVVAVIITGDGRLQKMLTLMLPLVAMIVIDGSLSRFFKVRMWGVAESASNPHTVSMMVEKIRGVFSAQGMLAFIREMIGQLWYLGVSTFGLFYMGLVHVLSSLKECVAKQRVRETLAWGMVLLGFAFSLGVSLIYWYSVYIPTNPTDRRDIFFYGRYIENWTSIFVVFGCCRLSKVFERRLSRIGVGLFAALHLLASFSITSVPNIGSKMVNRVCVSGMVALSELFSKKISVWMANAVFLIVVTVFALFIILGRRNKKMQTMICLPLFIAMLVSVVSSNKHVESYIIDHFQKSLSGLSQTVESELKIPDGKSMALVGFPKSNDRIGTTMKRLQFLKPQARCSFGDENEVDKYFDGRADYLLLSTLPGFQYGSDALKQHRGIYLKDANAIAFNLVDKTTDPGVDFPVDTFSVQNGTKESDAIYSNHNSSFIMYGPYISLPAGKYSVTIEGRLIAGAFSDNCVMDVTVDKGKRQIAIINNLENFLEQDSFKCTCLFILEKDEDNCEFRLRTDSGARVAVTRVTLRRLDDGI